MSRLKQSLSAGIVVLSVLSAAQAITIATSGKPQASIVVGADATVVERYAADELARFLRQVTGGEFKVNDSSANSESRLLVGAGAARLADAQFSTDDLGNEGIVIRTAGNDLILAGGRPRGTLYAVYTFLDEQVGIRWWSPSATFVPSRPDLRFDKLDVRYIPPLEYREPFWFSAFDGDWAARNRSNGPTMRLEEKHGGKHVIEGFVHTFFLLIPPEKYFKTHPEWFSEIDGKRKSDGAQLCLTNDEMRAELVKNLKARLAKNPAATMASVSQNDCYGFCTCPKCAAVDREEGSQAGTMLRFVNQVADEFKDKPNFAISTLAYQYSRKSPLHVKPRPNVVVWLCSIECSFAKPLTDKVNETFRNDIEGWSKICNRLYIWDYTTNFRHYILPHPNYEVLGPNVRFFADHGVKGLFEQGAYHTWGAEMMELRAWVLAKLLWNPSFDGDKLTEEFITGYYGPAAPHVRAYLKLMEEAVTAMGDPLGCFSGEDAKFLSARTLATGWEHLKKAEQAVKDDPALLERVKVAQLPIVYTYLIQWERLRKENSAAGLAWPVADSQAEAYRQFMAVAESIKMTHVAEGHEIGWLKTQIAPAPTATAP